MRGVGLMGDPAPCDVAEASAQHPRTGTDWRGVVAALPAAGAALLPKLACPACWPAYSALLGAVGLGFVNYTPYLPHLTAAFLLLAVGSLGYQARRRRGYGPFALGLAASLLVMVGRFVLDAGVATFGGIAALAGASLWNAWPRRGADGGPCRRCAAVFHAAERRSAKGGEDHGRQAPG